jgi:hypothetical protein
MGFIFFLLFVVVVICIIYYALPARHRSTFVGAMSVLGKVNEKVNEVNEADARRVAERDTQKVVMTQMTGREPD